MFAGSLRVVSLLRGTQRGAQTDESGPGGVNGRVLLRTGPAGTAISSIHLPTSEARLRTEKIYGVWFRCGEKWHYEIMQILAWLGVMGLETMHQFDGMISEEEYQQREMDKRCKAPHEWTFTIPIKPRLPDPSIACKCDTHCAAGTGCPVAFERARERARTAALPPPEPEAQS